MLDLARRASRHVPMFDNLLLLLNNISDGSTDISILATC